MERLWTPWRMQYVQGGGSDDSDECFLCRYSAAPAQDEGNLVLYRNERALVVMNRFPYNSGHLMIAPHRHTGELAEMDAHDGHAVWDLSRLSVAVLQDVYGPDGFNVGMNLGRVAGAGLPGHVHLHVVPRWGGDTNFMPVLSETRVLPELLAESYRRLRPGFRALDGSGG